jgi:UDP-N-acetylglucosamine transferase subunit ALG13
VVAHAGTGSALAALEAGKCAILVPRERAHGEHVDDHQVEMARELAGRSLVVAREAADVTVADLEEAAAWSVRTCPGVAPFRFTPAPRQPSCSD